jgi:hypothetical protein
MTRHSVRLSIDADITKHGNPRALLDRDDKLKAKHRLRHCGHAGDRVAAVVSSDPTVLVSRQMTKRKTR